MTQNEELSGALTYFGGVFALIIGVVVLAILLRRKDRARLNTITQQLGLQKATTANSTDPRIAKLVSGDALNFGDIIDPLNLVGATSMLTRRKIETTMKVKSAYVVPAQMIQRPGVVALVRGSTTTKATSVGGYGATTTGTDVVVARLRRPIAEHLHFMPLDGATTPAALTQFEGPLMKATNAIGQQGSMLADQDLRYQFISRSAVDHVIARDESLRALLWAARRFPNDHATTPATQRYESMIPPMHDKFLNEIWIFGDLLVLTGQSSPFQSGVRNHLIEMAQHFSTTFH